MTKTKLTLYYDSLVDAGKVPSMRTLLILLGVLSVFILQLTVQPASAVSYRVLIISGRNDHDWQQTTPFLSRIILESGLFSVSVLNDPNEINSDLLQYFDVILSNWSAFPQAAGTRWNMVTEIAFTDFVEKGKGFVLFHSAGAAHQDWPEFQKMIGATWDKAKSGQSEVHTFKVVIKDKTHPITKDMPDFWIKDELWYKMRLQPGVQILCTAQFAKEQKGTGKEEPIAICSQFGSGRCFYNFLGNDLVAMDNIAWKTLMMRGIEWAATGQVTIEIPNQWPEWNE